MKKKDEAAIDLRQEPLAEEDYPRVVPIRTETTLTRYPFHRISKKTYIAIKQTRKNDKGKIETTWEVRNPPGPLAYKIDTIIVNRLIDERVAEGELNESNLTFQELQTIKEVFLQVLQGVHHPRIQYPESVRKVKPGAPSNGDGENAAGPGKTIPLPGGVEEPAGV